MNTISITEIPISNSLKQTFQSVKDKVERYREDPTKRVEGLRFNPVLIDELQEMGKNLSSELKMELMQFFKLVDTDAKACSNRLSELSLQAFYAQFICEHDKRTDFCPRCGLDQRK